MVEGLKNAGKRLFSHLLPKHMESMADGKIYGVIPGSSLDDQPIYEAEIVQIGTQFEWHEHLDVGDRVFISQHGGIVLGDRTILISALDIVAARHNGKIEKVEAPEWGAYDGPTSVKGTWRETDCTE